MTPGMKKNKERKKFRMAWTGFPQSNTATGGKINANRYIIVIPLWLKNHSSLFIILQEDRYYSNFSASLFCISPEFTGLSQTSFHCRPVNSKAFWSIWKTTDCPQPRNDFAGKKIRFINIRVYYLSKNKDFCHCVPGWSSQTIYLLS